MNQKNLQVIFKKYSPMGEMAAFAVQLCETLYRTTGIPAAITDRDTVLCAAGAVKRDLIDKHLSRQLEELMENRQIYRCGTGERSLPVIDGDDRYTVLAAAPILSEGDVSGCVLFLVSDGATAAGETEHKLVQTIAGFLGKQMES